MTFVKRLYVLFLTFALFFGMAVSLGGCNTETLTLGGDALGNLKSSEPDFARMREYHTEYIGPRFVLKERDGKVYSEEYDDIDDNIHFAYVNSQYLVGVDCGEFDGWVLLSDYAGFHPDGDGQFEKILEENCMGFLQKPTGIGEPEIAYIFTGMLHITINEGTLYRFENGSGPEWKLEKISDLGSCPCAFMYDENRIIVATNDGLIAVDPDTGAIETLCETDYWAYISPKSMVRLGDSYLISGDIGILEYRIESKKIVWYPYPQPQQADA